MDEKLIREQSLAAYGQWAPQWREHCKAHKDLPKHSLEDFQNHGIGRAVLCVANGYSLEQNMATIKEHRENVDILCCDKTLGTLIDNGIFPDFCMVCDANVDYDRYMKPWEDKLTKTVLFNNVCGNPKWSQFDKWKNVYFFVNKDILGSEKEFSELSGCKNFIPAGTNVSNAMVVLLTQCENNTPRNFFGYDKILLIGFDYSWKIDGKYYAYNETGDGKANYMRHLVGINREGDVCVTSGNLHFSAQWLDGYVKAFKSPVVQCSKNTILGVPVIADLDSQMRYRYKVSDSAKVKVAVKRLKELISEKAEIEQLLGTIAHDHFNAHVSAL